MTRNEIKSTSLAPQVAIGEVIARYGAWRLLIAICENQFRKPRGRRHVDAGDLSSFLRKDVGLNPVHNARGFWTYL